MALWLVYPLMYLIICYFCHGYTSRVTGWAIDHAVCSILISSDPQSWRLSCGIHISALCFKPLDTYRNYLFIADFRCTVHSLLPTPYLNHLLIRHGPCMHIKSGHLIRICYSPISNPWPVYKPFNRIKSWLTRSAIRTVRKRVNKPARAVRKQARMRAERLRTSGCEVNSHFHQSPSRVR